MGIAIRENQRIDGIVFMGRCRKCRRYFETCSPTRKLCNHCVVESRGINRPDKAPEFWPLLWPESEITKRMNEERKAKDGTAKSEKEILV